MLQGIGIRLIILILRLPQRCDISVAGFLFVRPFSGKHHETPNDGGLLFHRTTLPLVSEATLSYVDNYNHKMFS